MHDAVEARETGECRGRAGSGVGTQLDSSSSSRLRTGMPAKPTAKKPAGTEPAAKEPKAASVARVGADEYDWPDPAGLGTPGLRQLLGR